MHLLFVIDHFGSGGAQRQIINLATGLQNRGHNVEYFIYYPKYKHYSNLIDNNKTLVHEYNKSFRYDISVLWKLRDIIKKKRYDCVISFLSTPNIYSELAMTGVRKIPLIVSMRNVYNYKHMFTYRRLIDQLHRLSSFVTTNSHYQREQMEKLYPWVRNKIVTIYNGVDTKLFYPSKNKMLTNSNQNIKILVVATITQRKNVIGVAKALREYKHIYGNPPTIRWVGKISNNNNDVIEYNEARDILRKEGLDSKLEWLGERNDIPELLRSHHALLIASYREGLPNVICEAYASGIPVLASNIYEHPRIVKENETGYLFNPTDHRSIANALYRLTSLDTKDRCLMEEKTRTFAEKHFSNNVYIDKYEELIYKLVSNIN